MTVAQNIDYPLKIQKIEKEERACKVREAALVERQQLLCHLPVDYPIKSSIEPYKKLVVAQTE